MNSLFKKALVALSLTIAVSIVCQPVQAGFFSSRAAKVVTGLVAGAAGLVSFWGLWKLFWHLTATGYQPEWTSGVRGGTAPIKGWNPNQQDEAKWTNAQLYNIYTQLNLNATCLGSLTESIGRGKGLYDRAIKSTSIFKPQSSGSYDMILGEFVWAIVVNHVLGIPRNVEQTVIDTLKATSLQITIEGDKSSNLYNALANKNCRAVTDSTEIRNVDGLPFGYTDLKLTKLNGQQIELTLTRSFEL